MTTAGTPAPPYYAVIFTSTRTDGDNGYEQMADAMFDLASKQPGFLGFESARNEIGISVSYWDSPKSIAAWQQIPVTWSRSSAAAQSGISPSKSALPRRMRLRISTES